MCRVICVVGVGVIRQLCESTVLAFKSLIALCDEGCVLGIEYCSFCVVFFFSLPRRKMDFVQSCGLKSIIQLSIVCRFNINGLRIRKNGCLKLPSVHSLSPGG